MPDTYAHRAAARTRSMTWRRIGRKLIDLATAYLRFRSRQRETSMHEEQTGDQRGLVGGSPWQVIMTAQNTTNTAMSKKRLGNVN
jgi:hypothetical protein